MSRSGRWITALLGCVAVSGAAPEPADAQQYVTDDAAITEYQACQIQGWHGERSSWVLPACTPLPNLEFSAGLIAVWKDSASGHPEYVAQVKTLLRPLVPGGFGVGLVAGTGRDPGLRGTRESARNVYAYVPLSLSFGNDRLVLHQNTGWLYERRGGHGRHALTWAARGDVRVRGGIVLILDTFGSSGNLAEFQTGLRMRFRSGRIVTDLSYGRRFRSGRDGAGWTLGLTLATPPFL